MLHGVYIKRRPKSTWYLMSLATNLEKALKEVDKLLEKAKQEGNDKALVGIEVFDNAFYVPEIIKELSSQSQIYN